jgi:SNF2 family DNA or RNA helicase
LLQDERSLSEIFTELAAPSPRQSFLDAIEDIDMLLNLPLYSFQRTTVATMLEREATTAMHPDPTFVPLHSFDSTSNHHVFWIQPSTMQVVMEPSFYTTDESGGILSEEMGAGKTVILLALILATRGQLSNPDKATREQLSAPDKIEGSGVLTSLSLRTYQTPYHRQLRETHSLPSHLQPPTLVETTLHLLSVNPLAVLGASPDARRRFDSSSFAEALPHIRPFFLDSGTSRRGVIQTDKRVLYPLPVYLSHSTLVVVPSSLFERWKGEFYKFCGDGNLNVLFINDIKAKVPRAKDLVAFDVRILFTLLNSFLIMNSLCLRLWNVSFHAPKRARGSENVSKG